MKRLPKEAETTLGRLFSTFNMRVGEVLRPIEGATEYQIEIVVWGGPRDQVFHLGKKNVKS
jgi:hypothetical protein